MATPVADITNFGMNQCMSDKPARVESEFLGDVLESLKRRSKAFKHRNSTPKIERFIDVYDDMSEERIELRINPRNRQSLRVTLWSDRWIEVAAAEAIWQAGWKFEYQTSGRFVGGQDGRTIVKAIESTLSAMFDLTSAETSKVDEVWQPLLAKGPSSV